MTSTIPDPDTFLLLALALLIGPRPANDAPAGGTLLDCTAWTDILIDQIIASNPSLTMSRGQLTYLLGLTNVTLHCFIVPTLSCYLFSDEYTAPLVGRKKRPRGKAAERFVAAAYSH